MTERVCIDPDDRGVLAGVGIGAVPGFVRGDCDGGEGGEGLEGAGDKLRLKGKHRKGKQLVLI